MKIAMSAYSFDDELKAGRMTLAAAVKTAAQIGFAGFEMLPRYFKDGKGTPAECKELKKMLSDAGIELACYTLGNDFGLPEGPARRATIDGVKREIDMAVVMGTKTLRIESTFGPKAPDAPTFEESVGRVVSATKEVADHALRLGVRLGVENHGKYMGSFQTVAMLIRAVKSDAFGSVPDLGNFMVVDEDPLVGVRELAKNAIHVHAKDFIRQPPEPPQGDGWWRTLGGAWLQPAVVGEGDVPLKACLEALSKKGYTGWLSVEHETRESAMTGLPRSLANLKKVLGEVPK